MSTQRIKIGKSYVDLNWLRRQTSLNDVIARFNGVISETLLKEVWETIHGKETKEGPMEAVLPDPIEPAVEFGIEETVKDEVKPSNKNKNRGGK